MYKFNRFYLLVSLLASLSIPLIDIQSEVLMVDQVDTYFIEEAPPSTYSESRGFLVVKEENRSIYEILKYIYVFISILFFARFLLLNWLLLRKVRKCESVGHQSAMLLLHHDNLPVHSFLNYIFINQSSFEKGVNADIISHEMAHVNQKHTLDILLMELLISFMWFNPFLYFYRKFIRLNHEFLADDYVIGLNKNITSYSNLILEQVSNYEGVKTPLNLSYSSSFNYQKTKKRLLMMTKKQSKNRVLIKQILLIPMFVLTVFLFGTKTQAQDTLPNTSPDKEQEVIAKKEQNYTGLNSNQKEFEMLVDTHIKSEKNGRRTFNMAVDEKVEDRLKELFFKMSEKERSELSIRFEKFRLPFKRVSEKEFEEWKKPELYGVWIDEKRVDNKELEKYTKDSFSHFFKSRLTRTAKNYGKHVYQLDLSTNQYFKKFNSDQTLYKRVN